jgi:hypothetical protein
VGRRDVGDADAEPNPFPAGVGTPRSSRHPPRAEKNPAERFFSIREFAAALDAPEGAVLAVSSSRAGVFRRGAAFVDLSAAARSPVFLRRHRRGDPELRWAAAGLRCFGQQVFRFRGQDRQVQSRRAPGRESVLEGSVAIGRSRLRVAARLVDAEEVSPVVEQFDRDLADVFAVQDEIARMVVTR